MHERRITQRDVARAAGVTRPAVSLALRRHPGIPKETRDRILRIAEQLGYTPDPVLSAFSTYRWPASSAGRTPLSVALVEFASRISGYPAAVRQGAMARAQALGLSVTTFSLTAYGGNVKHLLHVMRARGIKGLLLLPADQPLTLDPNAGWADFSVVAATTSILAPRFHQVMPNQLYNMTALVTHMHQLGYRRIGGIFSDAYEQRTTHAYSMTLAWFGHRDRILILPGEPTWPENRERVSTWLRRHKLDLVFAPDVHGLARLAQPRTNARTRATLRFLAHGEYLVQFPELIGETAIRMLSGLMYSNETGIPAHPEITTIDGAVRTDMIEAAPGSGA
jgi:DNA-binding LacI/PurR family transcriptional regulator